MHHLSVHTNATRKRKLKMQEMSSTTADKWFYEDKGQRLGGIDESAMIAMIQSGKLRHGSSVWKQGFADWIKLEDTPLRIHLNQLSPPPLTGQHVSNTLIWVLAFAPILGLFLESFIAMLVYGNESRAMDAVSDGIQRWMPSPMASSSISP